MTIIFWQVANVNKEVPSRDLAPARKMEDFHFVRKLQTACPGEMLRIARWSQSVPEVAEKIKLRKKLCLLETVVIYISV